jgi:cytochrome c oxidase subunit 1
MSKDSKPEVPFLKPTPLPAQGAVSPISSRPEKAEDVLLPALSTPVEEPENYLNTNYSLKSWLLTTDHKRIAILYAFMITFFFFVGSAAAALIRLQLTTPQGHLVQQQTYNKLFTMHGVIMVWFFLIPALPNTLGNFLLPMMIGARDLAFPKLNLFSWYLFVAGGLFTLFAILTGGVDTGWTFYTPLSTHYVHTKVMLTAAGVFVSGFSSILTGLNFIVTIHRLRCKGMTWFRLPVFVWTLYATSLILVLGTPVLTITLILMGLERLFGIGVFDPALGGDPLLFQHLFWFYSHPAVYIMILPGMGVVSEIIPCFARKKLFSYKMVALAGMGIAIFGFLVWGHHMFVSGQSMYADMTFSLLSYLVAIPSAIKVFNWTATLYKGSIWLSAPMLYALGFIGLFTIGGLSGLFLASLPVDVAVHDTYFVIAHFHFIMVGGMVTAYLGGLHFWWPKITGRMYPEKLAQLSALLIFFGFTLTFLPQFLLGRLGMNRRYYHYAPEFQMLNVLSTAGASILAVGYLSPFSYLLWSAKYGRRVSNNPWGATGLEWQTASPPPTFNFSVTPLVTQGPYEYNPVEAERELKRDLAILQYDASVPNGARLAERHQETPDTAAPTTEAQDERKQ